MNRDDRSITLTGRVFVSKILGLRDHPSIELRAATTLHRGDMKLMAVSQDQLPKDKKKDRRFGPRGSRRPWQGFLVAYVWDGQAWRNFALRGDAAIKATYSCETSRYENSLTVIRFLEKLRGERVCYFNRTYEVRPLATDPPIAAVNDESQPASTDAPMGASTPEPAPVCARVQPPAQGLLFAALYAGIPD